MRICCCENGDGLRMGLVPTGAAVDVGIQGEWIREIGDLSTTPAHRVLDCTRLFVGARFHRYAFALGSGPPGGAAIVAQDPDGGDTGRCLGQDEASSGGPHPTGTTSPGSRRSSRWLLGDYPMAWPLQRVEEYLRLLHRRNHGQRLLSCAPRGASLVGDGNSRSGRRRLRECEAMWRASCGSPFRRGPSGVSTGLIYPPCIYAAQEELLVLARTTAETGGFWVVHLRKRGEPLCGGPAGDVGISPGPRAVRSTYPISRWGVGRTFTRQTVSCDAGARRLATDWRSPSTSIRMPPGRRRFPPVFPDGRSPEAPRRR